MPAPGKGDWIGQGVPAAGGVPTPVGCLVETPPLWTATAAGGTHPTGMHSCSVFVHIHVHAPSMWHRERVDSFAWVVEHNGTSVSR